MKLSENRFVVGGCYLAIPAIREQQRRIAVVVGRQGMRIQLAWVDDLTTGEVDMQIGREFCVADCRDGRYSLSCATPIDTYTAIEVKEIIENGRLVDANSRID